MDRFKITYWVVFSALYRQWLRLRGISVGAGVVFLGMPIIRRCKGSQIIIGDNCRIVSNAQLTDLGVSRPTILRTLNPDATLEIGSESGLSGVTICAAVAVRVGESVLFGADVLVADTDFHLVEVRNRRWAGRPDPHIQDSVTIETDVFIGARSVVLKGVRIGRGSVIGAGSVVTKDVPADCVAAGNPAHVIRQLEQ